MAEGAAAEHVALIGHRQAAGVEAEAELAQLAAAARVAHGEVEEYRCCGDAGEAGGVHPDRPRVADVGGMEVGSRAVGDGLRGDGRGAQHRERGEERQPAAYGSTCTVDLAICLIEMTWPRAGTAISRSVVSVDSRPR